MLSVPLRLLLLVAGDLFVLPVLPFLRELRHVAGKLRAVFSHGVALLSGYLAFADLLWVSFGARMLSKILLTISRDFPTAPIARAAVLLRLLAVCRIRFASDFVFSSVGAFLRLSAIFSNFWICRDRRPRNK